MTFLDKITITEQSKQLAVGHLQRKRGVEAHHEFFVLTPSYRILTYIATSGYITWLLCILQTVVFLKNERLYEKYSVSFFHSLSKQCNVL